MFSTRPSEEIPAVTRSDSSRWLIIADDLTGAMDTAAPFAMRGYRVEVVADLGALPRAVQSDAAVVTVSTRSREIPPPAAALRVAEALAALAPDMRLLKKVDSRMKGNVAAELDPVPGERLLVLPGLPEFGRVVRGGHVHGFGVPTPIAIAGPLGAHASRAAIPDVETVEAMDAEIAAMDAATVLVGARGAARALAARGGRPLIPPFLPPPGRLLMVIGSRDAVTLRQIALLRERLPGLNYIPAPNGVAPEDALARAMQDVRPTLVHAVQGESMAAPVVVAQAMARSATMLAGSHGPMLACGGATAEAVLASFGIPRLALLGEMMPGLPVAQGPDRLFITKSGGIGGPEALITLCHLFETEPEPQEYIRRI